MYYKPDINKVFKTHSEIRSALTNVLFPQDIDDNMLLYQGVFPLDYAEPEVVDGQIAIPLTPQIVDDTWTQMWEVRDATAEELAEIKAAKKALVPASVTRRQAKQALLLRGFLDAIPTALDSIPDPTQRGLSKIEWDESLEFYRNRPLVIQIGAALGLDEDELDELFIFANAL